METRRDVLRAWFLLFRPWSYVATLVPFCVAAGAWSACALPVSRPSLLRFVLGLVVGLLFQATVNLLNTWGDERSGVDDAPGAIRTTPQVHDGLVSLNAVLAVALACAAAAGLLGVALCFMPLAWGGRFDVPLLVAGFIGCLGALNYSTGVRFKYHGLGVPFVSVLMGPLELFVALELLAPDGVLGEMRALAFLLLALPIAALVGVVMHGNDMRDIPSDRAAGIVTLASFLGPRGALVYYVACHVIPYAVCVVWVALERSGAAVAWFLLPFLCLPLTVKTLRTAVRVFRSAPANPPWRGLERASGGILFVFGLLYALAFPLVSVKADLVPAGTDAAISFHPSTGALSVTAGDGALAPKGRRTWGNGEFLKTCH